MNKAAERLRKKEPLEILSGLGVRTSAQRVAILSYLLEHDTHPTVDTIYRDLAPVTPGLSKTTVYNTVKLLVTKGIVSELSIEGKEQRYDIMDRSHGHLMCRGCGRLFDIEIHPQSMFDPSIPPGFHAEEYQLYIKGLCPECA